jgi:hypothetical protein
MSDGFLSNFCFRTHVGPGARNTCEFQLYAGETFKRGR